MGFKSMKRQIYRRKKQSKKHRRKDKFIYGGANEQVQQTTPSPSPSFKSNLALLGSVVAQGVNNITNDVIKKGAKLLVPNIDTEKPVSDVLQESKDELKKVVNVLQSPVGDELVKEVSVIGEKMVDAVEKPFEEIGDRGLEYVKKQIPVVEDMAKTTLFGLPVIGSAAAAAEDAFDVVQSIENTVEAGSDILQEGKQMLSNLQQPVAEANQLYSKYQNALNTNLSESMANANSISNSMANSINKSVSDIASNSNKQIKNIDNISNIEKNMKNYQNIGKMIGGRTRKSQSDFFAPLVTSSKMIKMVGGRAGFKTRKLIRNKRKVLR